MRARIASKKTLASTGAHAPDAVGEAVWLVLKRPMLHRMLQDISTWKHDQAYLTAEAAGICVQLPTCVQAGYLWVSIRQNISSFVDFRDTMQQLRSKSQTQNYRL